MTDPPREDTPESGGPFDVGSQIDGPDDPLFRGAAPEDTRPACPTCGSDHPRVRRYDNTRDYVEHVPGKDDCPDPFHVSGQPDEAEKGERWNAWRCPVCRRHVLHTVKSAAFQMVTCSGCGSHYRCTPSSDYYNNTTLEDGVCECCLLAGKRGANPPDPNSRGPLLQTLIDSGRATENDDGTVTL